MDSRGNIYEKINEKEALNVETKKVLPLKEVKFDEAIQLTPSQKDMLLSMNRKERRKWFRDHKKGVVE